MADKSKYANYEVETCVTFRPATDSKGTTPLKFLRITVYSNGDGIPSKDWTPPIPAREVTELAVLPPAAWFNETVKRTTEFASDFNFKEDRGDLLWKYVWELNYQVPTAFISTLAGCKNIRVDVQAEIDLGPSEGASTPVMTIDVGSLLANSVVSSARVSRLLTNITGNRASIINMSLLGTALQQAASQFLVIKISYDSTVRWPTLPAAMLSAFFKIRFNISGWGLYLAWKPGEQEGWEVIDMPPE